MSLDSDRFWSDGICRGAAPLGSERPSAAFNVMTLGKGIRKRKRGPRSLVAYERRKHRRIGGAPADATLGESGVDASVLFDPVSPPSLLFYMINIRCLLSNFAELCHQLDELCPHVILLQETWLNKSVEEIRIPGYKLISRRDRSEGENRGGIVVYAQDDVRTLVEFKVCLDAERIWLLLHLDVGTIAVCNWYRPGAAGEAPITSLAHEITELRDEVIGFLIMGDCNIHQLRWLLHSNANTAEGELLKRICDEHSLKQMIDEPTRGDYLLDLVLTDLENCKTQVVAPIADHRGIVAKVAFPCPKALLVSREVWHFKGAAWQNLKCALRNCSWDLLREGSVDEAVNYFLDLLLAKCEEFIPRSKIIINKATHPWLADS